MEKEFEDPLIYKAREKMFIISSDCFAPAPSCFCNVMDGKPFSASVLIMDFSQVKDGFIVEVGSEKGKAFVTETPGSFQPGG